MMQTTPWQPRDVDSDGDEEEDEYDGLENYLRKQYTPVTASSNNWVFKSAGGSTSFI
jgi:hypothetical protein